MKTWVAIVAVFITLACLLAVLAWWNRKYSPHPELLRKTLHVGMGLVTLAFPWLFESVWPVALLAFVAILLMLALRLQRSDSVKSVVHGVARVSLGEIYFPVAIVIVFALSKDNPMLFVIPILILTLADAAAALIGLRYGLLKFSTTDGYKSMEGSTAFFTVAFMSTLVPLLLFTQVGRAETLLIALIIAMLVMYIEAISWEGLDNLFIPLGGFLLLKVYIDMSVMQLGARLVVIIALFMFMLLQRKKTSLNDGAILAAGLVGYFIWAAGDWTWLLPALLVFIRYQMLLPVDNENKERVHDVRAVLAVSIPALVWLFLARQQHLEQSYFPFIISLAGQLGILTLVMTIQNHVTRPLWYVLLRSTLEASMIMLLFWLLVISFEPAHILYMLAGIGLTGLAVSVFYFTQPVVEDCPVDAARFWRQGVISFACSLLAYAFISIN